MKAVMLAVVLTLGCSDRGVQVSTGDGGDWIGHDLAGPSCASLDESGCKSDPRCVADYCNGCSCTGSFAACRAPSDPQTPCPALPCPFVNCACTSLDAATCGSSMGCTALTCADCNGNQQFLACLSSGATPPPCPAGLCPLMGCRNDSECNNIGYCLPPGKPACGDAFPPPCESDAACTGGTVCADDPCVGKLCMPPCTASSCAVGQACVNQRCVAQPCAGSCPSHFACVGGACQRQTCLHDADCPGGACVDTQCWDAPGVCTRPAG